MYIIGVFTPTISTPPSARIDRKQEAFDIFFKSHKPSDFGGTAEPDRAGSVSICAFVPAAASVFAVLY